MTERPVPVHEMFTGEAESAQRHREELAAREAERREAYLQSLPRQQAATQRAIAARQFAQQTVPAALGYARDDLQRAISALDIEAAVAAQTRVLALQRLLTEADNFARNPR